MEIHIRPGSAEELPELITLQTLSLETIYANEYNPEQMKALVDSQAEGREQEDESIVVAEIEGKIVGFASLSNVVCQIYAVYVHPDWIRRGIGKQLLAAIEDIAIQRRYRTLVVFTSTIAAPFYQVRGYKIQQPFQFQPRPAVYIPCQVLEKRLLPPASFLEWAYRHRFILLLLFGVILVLTIYSSKKQDRYPEFDAPAQETLSL